MSSRREALFERYRARSLDRIRKLALALMELEEGRAQEALAKDVARDLHTLKGDSTVVGMARVSEVAHLAEELLLAAQQAGGLPRPDACAEVRRALDVVNKSLKGELGEREAADAILAEVRDKLHAALPTLADGESAPALLLQQAAGAVEPDAPPQEAPPQPEVSAPSSASVPRAPAATEAAAEAPAERQPEHDPEMPGGSGRQRFIQVNASRIDFLCEQVSEFANDFRSLAFGLHALSGQMSSGNVALGSLVESMDRCRMQFEDVFGSAWSLRLVPIEPALEELVRHAHDLAEQQGKRVRVLVRGEGAEVERGILDELWEPLLHLVRNAVDHGLETPAERGNKGPEGSLTLQATPAGSHLLISVADDGKGVDVQAVRNAAVTRGLLSREAADALPERDVLELLFVHGFSTRATVTDVSGRGVGLDVVREKLDTLGGSVSVNSQPSRGTRFELTVPATIGKERALVVECAGGLYGIPAAQVLEVVDIETQKSESAAGGEVLRFRDEPLPLRSLANALGAEHGDRERWAIVLESGNRRWAFGIPRLVGEYELLRRPVDALLTPFGHVGASATLDDGRLVLLLSIGGLIRRTEFGVTSRPAPVATKRGRRRILVVDDSATVRDVICEILTDAGLEVQIATNGQEALAAIDSLMPDLVLSDVEMPIMNGFELLKRIRARWQHLPVIMLTTRGGAEDRRQATALGANAYLVKSAFEEATLMETVRRFFGASA